jgi:hypothetical protein
LLLLYEAIKLLQPDFIPTLKGELGLPALGVALSASYFCLVEVRKMPDRMLAIWLRLNLALILGAILFENVLGAAGLIHSAYRHYVLPIDRWSGLYAEPSFIALAIGPYIFFAVNNFQLFKRYLKLSSLYIMGLIVILDPSATLIGVSMLAGLFVTLSRIMRGRLTGIVGGLVVFIALGVAVFAVPDISERFIGVMSATDPTSLREENGSSLLFTKGRQMATYALMHQPLGVAFQNMQILAPESDVSYISNNFYDLNSADGTSILFKGASEFGWLFLVLAAGWLWRFMRDMIGDPRNSLFTATVLLFEFSLFEHFIRGTSYFNGVISIGLAIFVFSTLNGRARRGSGFFRRLAGVKPWRVPAGGATEA